MLPKNKNKDQQFFDLIHHIEDNIATYYGLELLNHASQYILEYKDIILKTQREPSFRAEICLIQENEHETFLGIYFSDEIRKSIIDNPPQVELSQINLDAFCILVEEISHFHLIIQRSLQGRQVSHLELEWQAESDKVLISSLYLKEQTGDWHLDALTRIIFDQSKVLPLQTYQIAHKYAAKFWHQALAMGLGNKLQIISDPFKKLMQQNYHKPLQEKFPFSPGEASSPIQKKYASA